MTDFERATREGLEAKVRQQERRIEELEASLETITAESQRGWTRAQELEAELDARVGEMDEEIRSLRDRSKKLEKALKWYATDAPNSVAKKVLDGKSLFEAVQDA